jgi:hypothetical protein
MLRVPIRLRAEHEDGADSSRAEQAQQQHRHHAADGKHHAGASLGGLLLPLLGWTILLVVPVVPVIVIVVIAFARGHFELAAFLNRRFRALLFRAVVPRGHKHQLVALAAADLLATLVVRDGVDHFASRAVKTNDHGVYSMRSTNRESAVTKTFSVVVERLGDDKGELVRPQG